MIVAFEENYLWTKT